MTFFFSPQKVCRFFDGVAASSSTSKSLPVTVAVMPCSDGDNSGDAESLAKTVCTALELTPKSGLKQPFSWNFLFASPPVDQVRKGEREREPCLFLDLLLQALIIILTLILHVIHSHILCTCQRWCGGGPFNFQNLYN